MAFAVFAVFAVLAVLVLRLPLAVQAQSGEGSRKSSPICPTHWPKLMLSRHAAYSILDRVGDAEMVDGSFMCGSTRDVGGQILAAPIKIRMLQAVVFWISNIIIEFHNLRTQTLRNERTM